ncbi:hypothetical protein pdam_00022769 [Pocillopora damicornis]|uniref:Uncharacterized protein n=1 Tax=Pocillopora damicornis TaxID=46731 RepID=A0A3M6UN96_POCDA|nr:hypothetical protein pdam_00022769 [Pocillopora damicornis]
MNFTTDQSVIYNQNILVAKQNETQNEEVGQSPIVLAKVCRDSGTSRLLWKNILNLFDKSKTIRRYVRSRIVLRLPHSHRKRFYRLTTVIILKPDCIEVNQLKLYFAFDCVYVFKQVLQSIKRREISAVFQDEFVHVVQCCSIKCKKRNHKYFVSRAKLLTSGEIELNPGPVTLGNKPNHLD